MKKMLFASMKVEIIQKLIYSHFQMIRMGT
nr:MAG TPA: hypothetical protein [Caudoviricetes sp.]